MGETTDLEAREIFRPLDLVAQVSSHKLVIDDSNIFLRDPKWLRIRLLEQHAQDTILVHRQCQVKCLCQSNRLIAIHLLRQMHLCLNLATFLIDSD